RTSSSESENDVSDMVRPPRRVHNLCRPCALERRAACWRRVEVSRQLPHPPMAPCRKSSCTGAGLLVLALISGACVCWRVRQFSLLISADNLPRVRHGACGASFFEAYAYSPGLKPTPKNYLLRIPDRDRHRPHAISTTAWRRMRPRA